MSTGIWKSALDFVPHPCYSVVEVVEMMFLAPSLWLPYLPGGEAT
jgi:hypothetical protein